MQRIIHLPDTWAEDILCEPNEHMRQERAKMLGFSADGTFTGKPLALFHWILLISDGNPYCPAT
jgi:hypothetical protein